MYIVQSAYMAIDVCLLVYVLMVHLCWNRVWSVVYVFHKGFVFIDCVIVLLFYDSCHAAGGL